MFSVGLRAGPARAGAVRAKADRGVLASYKKYILNCARIYALAVILYKIYSRKRFANYMEKVVLFQEQ